MALVGHATVLVKVRHTSWRLGLKVVVSYRVRATEGLVPNLAPPILTVPLNL